jgi:serine protease
VKVMPVRVLGKCGGYDSDILVGMQWAAGVYSDSELAAMGLPANPNPAKVISMSLGSVGSCSQPYRDAMTRLTAAKVVVVSSAATPPATPSARRRTVRASSRWRAPVGDKVGFSDLGPEIAISAGRELRRDQTGEPTCTRS